MNTHCILWHIIPDSCNPVVYSLRTLLRKNTSCFAARSRLGSTFDQLQGAELSCFELLARLLQVLEMKLRDKVAGSLFGWFNRGGQPHLPWDRADSWTAHDRARTGGVCFRFAGKRDSSCQGASKAKRRTIRRAARRRQEEMTVPGEKGVGVLLAESVQQGTRPASRELLPLPIPFPENEHVESERLRSLRRAVRSRVKRRVGWQGWANAEVRSMNEIYSKTSASEAGSRPSSLQLASLSRICSTYQGISAAECKSAAEAFKALCGSAPGHTRQIWCQTGHLQGGSRFLARPMFEDGRWC